MSKQALIGDIYPLSPMQQGLLFHALYEPGSGEYVGQSRFGLRGALDVEALRRAWQGVLDRHPVLRTGFTWEGVPEPLQVVRRAVELPLVEEDWRGVDADEQDRRMEAFLRDDRARGFDPARAPLMRIALFRTGDAAWRLVWTHHHLALDGWSVPLVFRDVVALYDAHVARREPALPPARPFRDYIAWLKRQDLARAERYWRRALEGFRSPTPLGVDRPAAGREEAYGRRDLRLGRAETAALQAYARRHGLTVNTLVQGAWALHLARAGGEAEVVFGATVSGRPAELAGVEEMVGLFINTLPVRVRVGEDERVMDWLRALQARQAELREYEYSPLAQVQRWSEVPAGTPLFESILVFANYPAGGVLGQGEEAVEVEREGIFEQASFPLTVSVTVGAEVLVRIEHDGARATAASVDRVLARLETALRAMTADADARLSSLELLSAEERRRVVEAWNATDRPSERGRCVHALFEAQAARTPDAPAVVHDGGVLTYRELDARANRLARHLGRLRVAPEAVVALCLERSAELVVAMLAVLKAGGAYLPLDPAYPRERLLGVLEDSGARVLLTTAALRERLEEGVRGAVVCLDGDAPAIDAEPDGRPECAAGPGNLAYVIYTSGSTGRPKGVAVEHGSVSGYAAEMARLLELGEGERVLQFASPGFDVVVEEVFPALASGAAVVASGADLLEPAELARVIAQSSVTVIELPTAYWHEWVRGLAEEGERLPPTLRLVLMGGERVLPERLRAWREVGCELIHVFGLTETTVTTTIHRLSAGADAGEGELPIGPPIANQRVYVLDAGLRPVPVGAVGEMYIGGEGVARGYLGRAALTAARFVPDPFRGHGARLYRTGDRVRWRADGALEFLGRADEQVKVRGYRIEPGEIESVLAGHPAVGEAVVVAREDVPGERRLAAYVVARDGADPRAAELRAHLAARLPDHMVPAAFVVLERLPLTPNGKVDRRALPAPEHDPSRDESYVAPRTPVEETLAAIWGEVLRRERVGVHDDFFQLGGDSILTIQIVSRARKAGLRLTPRQLFEEGTIAALAQVVASVARDEAPPPAPADAAAGGARLAALPAGLAASAEDAYPLSPLQEGMLFQTLYEPGSGVYVGQLRFALRGELDVEAFRRAWAGVLGRHAALRTSYLWEEGGQPLQVVRREAEPPLREEDWRGLDPDGQEERLRAYLDDNRARGFDPGRAPLLRLALFRTEEDAWRLVWSFHQMVLDGWSLPLVFRDVMALYQAHAAGTEPALPPPVPYRRYVDWLARQDLARAEAWWRRELAGFAAPTPLGIETAAGAPGRYRRAERRLDEARTAALHAFAGRHGLTVNTLVQGAWALLVSRYAGERDVVFGTTLSGRPAELPGVEEIVGMFINTLPLRARVDEGRPAVEWLRELQARQVEMREYEYAPLAQVQRWSEVPAGTPLFDSIVVFNNYPAPDAGGGDGERRLRVDVENEVEQASRLLILSVIAGSELALRVEFDGGRVAEDAAERLCGQVETLLLGLAARPDARLSDVELLDVAERRRVVEEWNATARPSPRDRCLHELFEAQAARTPDAPAVVHDGGVLAYGELDERAARLARHLACLGVGAEGVVAICLERSPEMVVAMLAVLKAGGAFLPIDPEYPRERMRYLLEDSGARVLLTDTALRERLEAGTPAGGATVVCLDGGLSETEPASAAPRPGRTAGARALAYVIYTSGSTGRPKGVGVEHGSASGYSVEMARLLELGEGERMLQFASPGFDVVIEEVFPALVSGAAVVVSRAELLEPAALARVIDQSAVTVMELPTAYWHEWVRTLAEDGLRPPPTLRRVLMGGERVLPERLRAWRETGCELIHVFGLTETTVTTTIHRLPAGEDAGEGELPIGRPIANARVYLLDAGLRPVPVGVPGEMYIGGEGVARGYRGRPALTARRFVPDPFSAEPGARLYRTGDRVRWRADGALEFLGRADEQVKVRGYRIEPGEIEAALGEHPAVADAVVVVREDAPGQKRLVAYLVAREGFDPQPSDLRAHLAGRLPDYMVPGAFVAMDRLPLTPNGKVDRRALPAPEGGGAERGHVAPRTQAEEALAEIWREVLGAPRVGVHDDFFGLGGDSILSIQVVARARRGGLSITPRQLFEHPTVAELAAVAGVEGGAPEAEQGIVEGPVALTPIQRGFFADLPPAPHHWNLSVLFEVRARMDAAVLERAVARVAAHHDALRMRFRQVDGEWRQENAGLEARRWTASVDLSALGEAEQPREVERWSARLQTSLSLEEGRLLRAVAFDRGEGRTGRLLIVVHHLVMDGVSWRVLLEDLGQVYEPLARGERPALPPKTTSFRRWAARLAGHVAAGGFEDELPYWLAEERQGLLPLPEDFPGGANSGVHGRSVSARLDEEETRRLLQVVPRAYRTQINDVLLAALARTLGRWAGEARVLVDVEGHGREEVLEGIDLSRTVGWFTTLYPVLLDLRGREGSGEALKAVKEQLRAVPNRGIGHGALRWLSPRADVREALAALPQARVRFEYMGQLDGALGGEEGLFAMAPEHAGADTDARADRGHLLVLGGAVMGGRLGITWQYSAGVHRAETVEALARDYLAELRALIAHCTEEDAGGRTPSDFPLARATQDEVDRLVGSGREVEDLYRLSPMQEGMLFHTLLEPGSGVYVAQFEFELRGALDVDAFRRAWRDVVRRHAVLRTGFAWEEVREPLQVVRRRVEVPLVVEDWRDAPAPARAARLDAYLRDDRARGFDPAAPPLLRLALFRTGDDAHRLVLSLHMMVLDGWSVPLLFRDVAALYDAHVAGREPALPPARPYRAYIAWLGRQDLAAAERWWRRELAGFDAPTGLGLERPAVDTSAERYGRAERTLGPGATERLRAFARAHGLTVNTLAQGAWALLLARYSGDADVVFGVTVSGRPPEIAGVEEMVGLFINTLPVRVRVEEEIPVAAWLRALQARQAEMSDYEFSPLAQVQRWSEVPAGTSLFDTLFVFNNQPAAAAAGDGGDGGGGERALSIAGQPERDQTNYPLTLSVALLGDDLLFLADYAREHFGDGAVARLLDHYAGLLEWLAADGDRPLRAAELLSGEARERVLAEWGEAPLPPSDSLPIHARFERQAARAPGAVAVVADSREWSYAEVDARANRLAWRLIKAGVGPDERVGVCMRRSAAQLVAVLAVLKAGGAYVPLDPAYPRERLAFMLRDARVRLLLGDERAAALELDAEVPVLLPDADPSLGEESDASPAVHASPLDLAYVIYTSGSTGRPKGVAMTRGALMALLDWQRRGWPGGESAATLQFASLSFDVSFQEIFSTWEGGGRLVMVDEETRRDPERLLEWVERQGVTRLFLPFVALQNLAEAADALGRVPAGVREVVTAGEALQSTPALRRWFARVPGAVLQNEYGPSETHVVSAHRLGASPEAWPALPPIGRPIAGARLYVLDPGMRPVPPGVAGELYIGGAGLARGYLERPGLTAARFVPDPFGGGGRIYRTGDRVRWLADGEIAFLGRLDGQVKVRGHRVEPGEVESVLLEHPGVPRAAVVVREGPSGDRRLVAYVAAGDAAPDPAELRAWLRERLPEPMVPSAVVVLESFPLTPSGKVDRRALPAPDDDAAGARGYVAPRTAAEAAIAGIWAEVLGRERVGAEDDFFELGGHSLLATRVASRVGAALGVRLPLRALFEAPTVAGVAARVEALLGAAPDAGPPPIVPVPRESGLPLSFAQQRLWLLHQMEAGGAYNIPVALRVSGALDAAALAWALTGVVRRHEVLRTTLHADADGRPVQVVGPPAPALLPAVDLSALDDAAREHEARRLARAESTLPFDLERGPLYRCALLRLAPGDTVVLFTLHHVVSDGWSMEILVREVSALYGAYLRGEAPALAPLAVQYADYAAWQRGWLRGEVMERELAYWRGALAGAPAVLALPTDRPRPPVQGFAGRSVSARLAPEVSARLAELGRREAATPNMALLAAFAAVLFRHTGQEKVIVGAPMANRAHPEVEGLIGFFVNLLPVCVDLSGDPPLLELVRRVRAVSLEAYTHQELPFERLVEALQVPRLPGVPPLVQAVFAFEHVPEGGEAGFPGLDVYPLAGVVDDTARFDLRLTVAQEGGALGASLAYDVALFDGATAARLLADFQAMADALAAAPETRVLDVPLAGRPAAAPAREEPRAALAESAEFDFEALGA